MSVIPNLPGSAQDIFTVSDAWSRAYPDAHAGVLVLRGVQNPAQHKGLEEQKGALEQELLRRYAGMDRAALLQIPILRAYDDYYRRFKKTYHVQLQLESILFKGKTIPAVAALVEAMFMAEMNTLLLTAGHDLDKVRLPLTLEVAKGSESYVLLRGETQTPKAGDMMICDRGGIVSSIIYGPDQRTQITSQTHAAVFTVYAPTGVPAELVERQLSEIQAHARVIAPGAEVVLSRVYGAAA